VALTQFLALRGWLDLTSGKDPQLALEHFDRAIELDKNVDAFLGKAQVFKMRHFQRNGINAVYHILK
jgi:hypothetical protein